MSSRPAWLPCLKTEQIKKERAGPILGAAVGVASFRAGSQPPAPGGVLGTGRQAAAEAWGSGRRPQRANRAWGGGRWGPQLSCSRPGEVLRLSDQLLCPLLSPVAEKATVEDPGVAPSMTSGAGHDCCPLLPFTATCTQGPGHRPGDDVRQR